MIKAVLISNQPKWCELIASGKKTIEVRKTRPTLETPFKCYIYQTKRTWVYNIYSAIADWQGNVIGEFVCDEIMNGFLISPWGDFIQKQTYLEYKEIKAYGKDKPLCFWHISELKIYDKPKELVEFVGLRKTKFGYQPIRITRPPQSWCYVEELW